MTDVPREQDAHAHPDRRDEFAQRYPDMRRSVHAYVRLRNPGLDADAISDEVIARTWKNWEQLRTRDDPMPWVFVVAHNLIIDLQKSAHFAPKELTEADIALVAPHVDAEKRVELLETLKAMLQLPDRQREALILASMREFTPEEIAEAMSCQARTVSRYLWDARRQLKRILGRSGRRRRPGRARPLPPDKNAHPDDNPGKG